MSKTYISKIEFGFPDGWVAEGTKSILWGDYFVFPYVGKNYNDTNNGWLGNGYMCKWPEEYPNFFQLKEENKSNDSFQWTDELVREYLSLILKGDLIFGKYDTPEKAMAAFKQSHTPKPQADNKYENKLSDSDKWTKMPYGKNYFDMPKPQPQKEEQRIEVMDLQIILKDGSYLKTEKYKECKAAVEQVLNDEHIVRMFGTEYVMVLKSDWGKYINDKNSKQ